MNSNLQTLSSILNRKGTCVRTAIICLALSAVSAWGQNTVSVRSDYWYPYNGGPTDAKPGYVIEILKAVFEKDGGKVDYQILPWKRAVAEAEKGAVDGVIGAFKSDTPDFVFPEEPIGTSGNIIFVRKGTDWKFTGFESLKGKRLGVINGYSYGDEVDEYVKAHLGDPKTIDESSGDNATEQAIRKLKAGRIDAFMEGNAVFWAQVTKMGFSKDDFAVAGVASEPEAIYVSFSPKKTSSAANAAKLTEGIRALRASGELARILSKYGVSDWAE